MPAGGASTPSLRAELEADIRQLEQEAGEIDMLMQQAQVEMERHRSRRAELEQRQSQLEAAAGTDPAELSEVRDGLLASTRREMLFDAQHQVLETKQRLMARQLQRLVEIDNSLADLVPDPGRAAPRAAAGLRPLAAAAGGSGAPGMNQQADELRRREELLKDIVRRLHDGPAQSIANIGMQAEIVERLIEREDARANEEVERLRVLVQQALDVTKDFIFEVRPMVLDDLGLGPTVRRATNAKARRAGIPVDFDSRGVERRLLPDVESAVYRCIEEAITSYLELKPPSVLVRLDWSGQELVATVEGIWPRLSPEGEAAAREAVAAHYAATPPALVAMMEEKRSEEREADLATRTLPPERFAEFKHRADALGLRLTMRDEGQVMELVAPIRA